MPGEHIIVGDMNLHHPRWAGPTYPLQHKLSDNLLEIVQSARLDLALLEGTITRDCQRGTRREQTTIDLSFASLPLLDQLVRCQVEKDIE